MVLQFGVVLVFFLLAFDALGADHYQYRYVLSHKKVRGVSDDTVYSLGGVCGVSQFYDLAVELNSKKTLSNL